MDYAFAAAEIGTQTTFFLQCQAHIGIWNDRRTVRIHILDENEDKIVQVKNIRLGPRNFASYAGDPFVQKDSVIKELNAKLEEVRSAHNSLVEREKQNDVEKEQMRNKIAGLEEENRWVCGEMGTISAPEMCESQEFETQVMEILSLQSQGCQIEELGGTTTTQQKELEENGATIAQQDSTIQYPPARQISTDNEPEKNQDIMDGIVEMDPGIDKLDKEHIKDRTAEKDSAIEKLDDFNSKNSQPGAKDSFTSLDGTSEEPKRMLTFAVAPPAALNYRGPILYRQLGPLDRRWLPKQSS